MNDVLIEIPVPAVPLTFMVGGKGFWSVRLRDPRPVTITAIQLEVINGIGELRVVIDRDTWDTATMGLIYTDPLWKNELNAYLRALELPTGFDDVSYSEQGMQGDDYVSLDVSDKFCLQALMKYGR